MRERGRGGGGGCGPRDPAHELAEGQRDPRGRAEAEGGAHLALVSEREEQLAAASLLVGVLRACAAGRLEHLERLEVVEGLHNVTVSKRSGRSGERERMGRTTGGIRPARMISLRHDFRIQ